MGARGQAAGPTQGLGMKLLHLINSLEHYVMYVLATACKEMEEVRKRVWTVSKQFLKTEVLQKALKIIPSSCSIILCQAYNVDAQDNLKMVVDVGSLTLLLFASYACK